MRRAFSVHIELALEKESLIEVRSREDGDGNGDGDGDGDRNGNGTTRSKTARTRSLNERTSILCSQLLHLLYPPLIPVPPNRPS